MSYLISTTVECLSRILHRVCTFIMEEMKDVSLCHQVTSGWRWRWRWWGWRRKESSWWQGSNFLSQTCDVSLGLEEPIENDPNVSGSHPILLSRTKKTRKYQSTHIPTLCSASFLCSLSQQHQMPWMSRATVSGDVHLWRHRAAAFFLLCSFSLPPSIKKIWDLLFNVEFNCNPTLKLTIKKIWVSHPYSNLWIPHMTWHEKIVLVQAKLYWSIHSSVTVRKVQPLNRQLVSLKSATNFNYGRIWDYRKFWIIFGINVCFKQLTPILMKLIELLN